MGGIYLFELGMGWLKFEGWSWETIHPTTLATGMLTSLLTFVTAGFYEELVYRGYRLQNLIEGIRLPFAILVSSIDFGLAHFANPNRTWPAILGLIVAGFFLAYGWVRTGRLWLPIGLHIGWNFFEGPIFGFPVSGISTTYLIRQKVVGPELITGGLFGPEAGLVILPTMAIATVLIWAYTKGRLVNNTHNPSEMGRS